MPTIYKPKFNKLIIGMKQTGTATPSAQITENTLGADADFALSRAGVGNYNITGPAGVFVAAKTYFPAAQLEGNPVLFRAGGVDYYYLISRTSATVVNILLKKKSDDTAVELSTVVAGSANQYLNFEIDVYND